MTMRSELSSARKFLDGMSDGAAPTPVLCAVSGGLDSMCLLHLLTTYGKERNLVVTAAHFNHRLRGQESDRDEAFVREWCSAKGVPLVCEAGDVQALAKAEHLTLEEAARQARYAFLTREQQALGCRFVLTAHHADDNAETILLNLLRGTGLRGLTGIPAMRGCVVRPFLQVSRQELTEYAAIHEIAYVEDSSNETNDASRNVLRHQVLPVLRQLNPRAVENMSRAAELLKQDEQALDMAASDLLKAACLEPGKQAKLPVQTCIGQPAAVVARTVWKLLCNVGGHQKDLSAVHVEAVCALLYCPEEREVTLPYDMIACREQDALVIQRSDQPPDSVSIAVGETVQFGVWSVTLSKDGDGLELTVPKGTELTVSPWRREDRMHLSGSRGSRSLKRLCSDAGIPPWKRETLPVLRAGQQAMAVPGVGIHMGFLPNSEGETVHVIFHQETEENDYEK